ncbi:MAG: precorrin-6y C5,15-methyltransferase (decarboxylating) subunit CbiE [Pseudomonadota bacterium]
MTPWLDIIGIGEDGVAGLSSGARTALEQAETIIGGERHHALTPDIKANRIAWPHPFGALIHEITSRRGKRLVILATGDPLWYSIGARIAHAIPPTEITYHPQLSAFQWAAARMGWSLADTETLTAHGRPTEQVIPWFWPGARLLVLTAGAETPGEVARLLADRGYGTSEMTVLGALGGPTETRFEAEAITWANSDPAEILPAFNTLAINCKGRPEHPLGRTPGLMDDAFTHDGKMTKRTVRAATLARLMPARGAVLWDIGIGCGSVAIEWMRAAPDTIALGLDPNTERLAIARENALNLGAPRLELMQASAPEGLDHIPAPEGTKPDLRRPDAVFIGGGLSEDTFERCWAALREGGRLVANAVTLQSETVLLALYAKHGGELSRIQTATASPVGGLSGWRPAMAVTQWALIK